MHPQKYSMRLLGFAELGREKRWAGNGDEAKAAILAGFNHSRRNLAGVESQLGSEELIVQQRCRMDVPAHALAGLFVHDTAGVDRAFHQREIQMDRGETSLVGHLLYDASV